MDRDYLDDRRFPPAEGSGVIVIQAPNERELSALVERLDRESSSTPRTKQAARRRSLSTAASFTCRPTGAGTADVVQSDGRSHRRGSRAARSGAAGGDACDRGRSNSGRPARGARRPSFIRLPQSLHRSRLHRRPRARRRRRRRSGRRFGRRVGIAGSRAGCRVTASPHSARRLSPAGRKSCGACSSRVRRLREHPPATAPAWCPPISRATSSTRSIAGRSRRLPEAAGRRMERLARPGCRRAISRRQTSFAEIERAAPDVSIVTIAPELDGGLDLVRWLVSAWPPRVARALRRDVRRKRSPAIAAGARQATHLFNRMPPLDHRRPASPARCSRPTR